MHALLISLGLVALAEIGDKTQLLSMVLSARYRKPWPILAGILAATVVNHLLSVAFGALLGNFLNGPWMKWVLGIGFIVFAAWTLVPDKMDDDDAPKEVGHGSVFLTTLVSFFAAEVGDKTQVVAIALGARFPTEVLWVAGGTTLGMMLANAPVVWLGHRLADRIPVKLMRYVAAAALLAQGVWTLLAKS
ncbi:MAG TPA: TMEM165/GDT1 family protein [Caulobacteraceae bacterium]